MANRFHVNPEGNPGPCSAEQGNCPFGSEAPHFSTEQEARKHYESQMESLPTGLAKPALERWSVAVDLAELRKINADNSPANGRDIANMHTALAHIQSADISYSNTPSFYRTLDDSLPYIRKIANLFPGSTWEGSREHQALEEFLENSELSLEKANSGSGYSAPVRREREQKQVFQKKPSRRMINEKIGEIVGNLSDIDARSTFSGYESKRSSELVASYAKRDGEYGWQQSLAGFRADVRLAREATGGVKQGSLYARDEEAAIGRLYPSGRIFLTPFGAANKAANEDYLNKMEEMVDSMDSLRS